MNHVRYVGELLKRSDALDVSTLVKTLQIARYAQNREAIRSAVIADMLDRLHMTWRTMDGWLNTYIDREDSPYLLEWMHLERAIEKARRLSLQTEHTKVEERQLAGYLWELVVMLSDAKWLGRMLEEADPTFFGHLAWQIMAVRQACKTALVMLEFDPQFDTETQRF